MLRTASLRNYIWYGLLAITIGLPFHAFLITWISAHTPVGIALPLRYWKELVFAAMSTAGILVLWRDRTVARSLFRDHLVWLLTAFALIHLLMIGLYGGSTFALILGLKINLAFLILTILVMATVEASEDRFRHLLYAILIPAGLVGLFAVLQLTILPRDFLTHFGYGLPGQPNPAYSLIENSNVLRISSFLWGPNQLGSYLILPLVLSLWRTLTSTGRQRIFAAAVFVLSLIALYGSQSRGAWLAALVGLSATVLLTVGTRLRLIFAGLLTAALVILATLNATHHLPARLELLLNHGVNTTNNHTGFYSSNTGHLRALTMGYDKLSNHPFGSGLEAAGRASEDTPGQLYTENFYLQLAVQTGWEGIILFLAIITLIGYRLVRAASTYPLAIPLFAALIGLSVNNLVAHTWSDGATAWIWWGAAGLILAGYRERAAA